MSGITRELLDGDVGTQPLTAYPWKNYADTLINWALEQEETHRGFAFDILMSLAYIDSISDLARHLVYYPGFKSPYKLHLGMQALVKLGLEPYWEAQFEAESYGFRPSRSAKDAIDAIFKKALRKPQYILDADIAKCFDQINHEYLLNKLDCPTVYKQLIRQWLKAGVMDNGAFEDTEAGTPQGGVISPLLANIALHGMIDKVTESFPKSLTINGKQDYAYRPKIVRYADDFVVMANRPEVILKAQELIKEWLKPVV